MIVHACISKFRLSSVQNKIVHNKCGRRPSKYDLKGQPDMYTSKRMNAEKSNKTKSLRKWPTSLHSPDPRKSIVIRAQN